MTDYQIPASAIEAAKKAIDADQHERRGEMYHTLEVVLRAAFDELGMRSYRIDSNRSEVLERVDISERPTYRLVSRWMPVEKP